jgi:3-deoxy-manno-octulosonate cytidylyltransferase (CMP-KDO synthetase)
MGFRFLDIFNLRPGDHQGQEKIGREQSLKKRFFSTRITVYNADASSNNSEESPMQKVAIIPARYGSTRFPGKPLALIAGKPMIQRVYELAREVPGLEEVYVATDDSRIAECVQAFGGKWLLTSDQHVSGSDRLAEAARLVQLAEDAIVVNIQGDQLVFPPRLIVELIASLQTDPDAAMSTPIFRFSDPAIAANPNVVKAVFDRHHYALYFSRSPIPCYRDSQGTPVFYKHIGIYVYRQAFLQRFISLPPGTWEAAEKLEQLRALEHGYKIRVVQTITETLEVDTPQDADRAAAFLESGKTS